MGYLEEALLFGPLPPETTCAAGQEITFYLTGPLYPTPLGFQSSTDFRTSEAESQACVCIVDRFNNFGMEWLFGPQERAPYPERPLRATLHFVPYLLRIH